MAVRPGFFFGGSLLSSSRRIRTFPTFTLGFRLVLLALALGAVAALACADGRAGGPHRGIEQLWRDFTALPRERALAIAGDPDGLWVAGAAGGEPSQEAAEARALEVCAGKRATRRLQMPCRLYSTGEEIVWRAW